MKKLMIVAAATLMVVSAVDAQTAVALKSDVATVKAQKKDLKYEKKEERKELRKLEGSEVSYQAQQAFLRDFNGALIIRSERGKSYDEFIFNQDGIATTSYYDEDAMLVGTSQIKTFTDLPAKAQQSIGKMYKRI